ncbi:unnamed protein product [marine sediment metagenome]|uniref:Uncharacterized protein n=1 Tax=marine sediment metagenome TaxID=412755 RepID=X1LE92_9ZZZZ
MEKVLPGGIYKDLFLTGNASGDLFTVPAGRIVELLYGNFSIATDATVGNRVVTIACTLAAMLPTVLPLFYFTLAASLTRKLAFGTSKPATDTDIDDTIQLPSRLLMNAGMEFEVAITAGEAGDYWYLHGKYIEWID